MISLTESRFLILKQTFLAFHIASKPNLQPTPADVSVSLRDFSLASEKCEHILVNMFTRTCNSPSVLTPLDCTLLVSPISAQVSTRVFSLSHSLSLLERELSLKSEAGSPLELGDIIRRIIVGIVIDARSKRVDRIRLELIQTNIREFEIKTQILKCRPVPEN